jgi:hypothetical protein
MDKEATLQHLQHAEKVLLEVLQMMVKEKGESNFWIEHAVVRISLAIDILAHKD